MADAFVSSLAADDTGDGFSVGTAKLTITAALGVVGATDTVWVIADGVHNNDAAMLINANRDYIIKGYDGQVATISPTGSTNNSIMRIRSAGHLDNKLTMQDLIINGNATATTVIHNDGDTVHAGSLDFNNITLNTTATTINGVILDASGGIAIRTVLFTNCDIDATGVGITLTMVDAASVTISGGSYSSAGTNIKFGLASSGNIPIISITNCTLNSTGAAPGSWNIDTSNLNSNIITFITTGCTIGSATSNTNSSNGIRVPEFADKLYLDNNNIYMETSSTEPFGIQAGADADTNTNPLIQVVVTNNHIEYTGTNSGHALLLGAGVNYAECSYNTILGADNATALGIIIKGEGNNVTNNIISVFRPILVKGGARNKIINNTCYVIGATGRALTWQVSTDNPDYNYIYNNIFDASNGEYALSIIDGEGGNNILDYNCYVTGSGGIAFDADNTNASYTLTQLQTQWVDQVGWTSGEHIYTLNDAESLDKNPNFTDADGGDFTVNNPLVKAGGKPDINGNTTTIGAIQPPPSNNNRFAKANRF